MFVERTIPITLLTPPCSPQTQTTTNYTPVPMYSTQNSLSPTGSSLSAGSLYRPQHLCSTNTAGVIPSFDHVTRDYNCALAQEKKQFYEDRARERASVITQPHRTLPVVSPKPKAVHDYPKLMYYNSFFQNTYPIGSYLRYVKDPTWHTTPTRSNIPQAEKLRQIATQYGAQPNEKLVNLQYNTPINIYSNQNVAKALNQNKGLNDLKTISYSNNLPVLIDLKSVPIPKDPKDNRILNWINARGQEEQDITSSPTWQYLQQENELKRLQRESPAFNRNIYPVQSHSFNTLRTSLLDAPGC